VHRGLGVHISFVRSISMDAFKAGELLRMQHGGNQPWKDFFDAHESNKLLGRSFDSCTINERYDSDAGEEWKERLSAKAEGREYVPGPAKPAVKRAPASAAGASLSGSRSGTPASVRGGEAGSRSESPALGGAASRKAANEAYFAKMGSANASRPDDVPPSQGGKYGGFGSDPFPQKNNTNVMDNFQQDPMATLTKGFGWLSTTVGQGAKSGYEGWLRPGMQKVSNQVFPPRRYWGS
jgi:ADP-ribosylation factor GTPase-activating protein 1